MEIKGSVLVHKVLQLSRVGEKGFVSVNSFRIFNKKMYVYIKASYTFKQTEDRRLPFERVSTDNDGFVFDFSKLSVTYFEQTDEPLVENGWIGPFDIDYSFFSYEKVYEDYSYLSLIALWLGYYNQYDEYMSEIFLSLKKLALEKMRDASFEDIDETISTMQEEYDTIIANQKAMVDMDEINQSASEEWFKIVGGEYKSDLYSLNNIRTSKLNQDISNLGLKDLNYILSHLDLTSEDALSEDYDKAVLIRARIDLLNAKMTNVIVSN